MTPLLDELLLNAALHQMPGFVWHTSGFEFSGNSVKKLKLISDLESNACGFVWELIGESAGFFFSVSRVTLPFTGRNLTCLSSRYHTLALFVGKISMSSFDVAALCQQCLKQIDQRRVFDILCSMPDMVIVRYYHDICFGCAVQFIGRVDYIEDLARRLEDLNLPKESSGDAIEAE